MESTSVLCAGFDLESYKGIVSVGVVLSMCGFSLRRTVRRPLNQMLWCLSALTAAVTAMLLVTHAFTMLARPTKMASRCAQELGLRP
jgi:hypothetical protein